jgi:glycosyltransferase involved in cell wall biosynthesis
MTFYPIRMQATVARRIDRVLTSSEASAEMIANDFGVSPGRIRNVSNGLDTELYSPDSSVVKDDREVLCVGRASDPNKGIRLAVEMLARLPADAHLTLVDSDHPGNEVFGWAREAGVTDRLTVTGRVPTGELVHLYRRAAVTIVPSRYEGFGLPAVESMACGTPAVTTDAGALPEVVRIGGGGVVVPRDDPEALTQAVLALLEAPERRRELASQGRRQVEARLSWRNVAAVTAEAYAEVLAERRGRPASTMTSASSGATRAMASSP